MARIGRFLATLLLVLGLAGGAAAFEVPGLAADSEAYAQSLAPRAPSSAEARAAADQRADAAIRAGNWAEAVTALEARIRLGEVEERHWLALAEAWAKRTPPDGNRALQAAWQAFAMVPGGAPEIPSILRIADIFQHVLDRPAQAIEALEAVIERDPANPAYRQRLAELRRSAGLAVRRVLTEPESDPPRACSSRRQNPLMCRHGCGQGALTGLRGRICARAISRMSAHGLKKRPDTRIRSTA